MEEGNTQMRTYRAARLIGAVAVMLVIALSVAGAGAVAPGSAPFTRTWARTDQPVAEGRVSRTWMWGPAANSHMVDERYHEAPNGYRQVQYFDKSRMEVTNDLSID